MKLAQIQQAWTAMLEMVVMKGNQILDIFLNKHKMISCHLEKMCSGSGKERKQGCLEEFFV
jgi:hypothetical protein